MQAKGCLSGSQCGRAAALPRFLPMHDETFNGRARPFHLTPSIQVNVVATYAKA
jgi:hypothetical protein